MFDHNYTSCVWIHQWAASKSFTLVYGNSFPVSAGHSQLHKAVVFPGLVGTVNLACTEFSPIINEKEPQL